MTKQEQIEAKRNKPIEVGDYVTIKIPYQTTSTVTEGRGKKKTFKEVTSNNVFIEHGTILNIHTTPNGLLYNVSMGSTRIPNEIDKLIRHTYVNHGKQGQIKSDYISPTFGECGANPFAKEKRRINFYNQEISSLLLKACYGRRSDAEFAEPEYRDKYPDGTTHGGVNFNPYIIDVDGKRQYYQRDFVWTLEQKQLLIDSIYNGIEIGKFLFRYIGWSRLEVERKETGHGHHFDCVDGKQRFFAILHFIQNKYPDSYGNYWKDLSPNAQSRLLHYPNLSYGELPETATDEDVIDNFLTLNFTGTPMSKEHIEYVKSFNIK